MAEARDLPGWPKKQLVKRVRAHLWHYGIRPQRDTWRATWSWASAVARSYFHTTWPTPYEIGTQYLLLLLARMHADHALRLPHRAHQALPDEVRQLLPSSPLPLLVDAPTANRKPSSALNLPSHG